MHTPSKVAYSLCSCVLRMAHPFHSPCQIMRGYDLGKTLHLQTPLGRHSCSCLTAHLLSNCQLDQLRRQLLLAGGRRPTAAPSVP